MNEDYLNSYKNYLIIDRKYSKNTINTYMNDLIKFNQFIDKKNILKISKKEIINFINYEKTYYDILYIGTFQCSYSIRRMQQTSQTAAHGTDSFDGAFF